jgi:hypothetical protein
MKLLPSVSSQTVRVTYPLKCFVSRPCHSAKLNEILYDCVHQNCPLSAREFKRADKIHVRYKQTVKSSTAGRQLLVVHRILNVTTFPDTGAY